MSFYHQKLNIFRSKFINLLHAVLCSLWNITTILPVIPGRRKWNNFCSSFLPYVQMDLQRPQPVLSYSNCHCSGSGLHPLFPGCYNNIPISYLFYLSHLTKKSMFTTLKIVHSIPCSKSKILHFRDFLLLNSILLSNLIFHMFISDILWLSQPPTPPHLCSSYSLGFNSVLSSPVKFPLIL